MDKKKQYEKTMHYYNVLLDTINKNKQEKKKQPGHLIFNLSTNPIYDGISVFGLTIGLSLVLSVVAKLPPYISIPTAVAGSFTTAMVMPMVLHKVFMSSKLKIGRGYAKMELDSYFESMKNYIKENLKSLMNSESYEDVTEEQLEQFAIVFGNITENYKLALDKYVGKKIYNKIEKDYKKIEHLLNREKNQDKNRDKVQKIIEKNEKILHPWCELYNSCGKTAKNLYNVSHELDKNFEILPDNKFVADYELLRKKVNQLVMKKAPAREIQKIVVLKEEKQKKIEAKSNEIKQDSFINYIKNKHAKKEENNLTK